jgi:hypothetical protein
VRPEPFLFFLAATTLACVVYRPIAVEPITRPVTGEAAVPVESAAKAHLLDGSVIVYEKGVRVGTDSLTGPGLRFTPALRYVGPVERVPLDSVAAMESFTSGLKGLETAVYSTAATALGVAAGFAVLKALFGSCPTFYADEGGRPVLQAEAFSYSIAPLFESRDVDRLTALPDSTGRLVLEMRNEALETHYVNHVEVLEVLHAADETVLPDADDRPLAFGGRIPIESARDRSGRDVLTTLATPDDRAYSTAPEVLSGATAADPADWIELSARTPAGVDSVAVILRLRNSLLNTVLLYDVMLGSQGARALDWIGRDLERVGEAARLGRWYYERMGLRIEVRRADGWTEVARVADAGPIAWKELAVVVPAPPDGRLRLSFLADQWRIDRVEIGVAMRRPEARTVPLHSVEPESGAADSRALRHLARPDGEYLMVRPGQSHALTFDVGPRPAGRERTLLLAAQGYYVEWIRGEWIRRAASGGPPFEPSDDALERTLDRWAERKDSFEREFWAARIPVR